MAVGSTVAMARMSREVEQCSGMENGHSQNRSDSHGLAGERQWGRGTVGIYGQYHRRGEHRGTVQM